jgi:hypothetical protein
LPIVIASCAFVLLIWKLKLVELAMRCGMPNPLARLKRPRKSID